MQILISSILSPKDMINVELNYRVKNKAMEGIIAGQLIEVIRTHFEEEFPLVELLPTILEEALFKKGCYPLLVLPESSIDRIINSDLAPTMESLRHEIDPIHGIKNKSIGILGNPKQSTNWSLEAFNPKASTLSLEDCTVQSFGKDSPLNKSLGSLLMVTDNINVLKYPRVLERLRKDKLANLMSYKGFGLESRKK